jgi:hypothetical protein
MWLSQVEGTIGNPRCRFGSAIDPEKKVLDEIVYGQPSQGNDGWLSLHAI